MQQVLDTWPCAFGGRQPQQVWGQQAQDWGAPRDGKCPLTAVALRGWELWQDGGDRPWEWSTLCALPHGYSGR